MLRWLRLPSEGLPDPPRGRHPRGAATVPVSRRALSALLDASATLQLPGFGRWSRFSGHRRSPHPNNRPGRFPGCSAAKEGGFFQWLGENLDLLGDRTRLAGLTLVDREVGIGSKALISSRSPTTALPLSPRTQYGGTNPDRLASSSPTSPGSSAALASGSPKSSASGDGLNPRRLPGCRRAGARAASGIRLLRSFLSCTRLLAGSRFDVPGPRAYHLRDLAS